MTDPLVPPECDCTDLDGFMLNVERLMASELVALSNHTVVAAALFLWCRAWKQRPAASLPDDDRVIAAFAKLSLAKFKPLKAEILRGFVKCSDGRLYHRVLAEEAVRAYEKKLAFQGKRKADAERLSNWRKRKRETPDETGSETHSETRFVQEGQGQGRDSTGTGTESKPPLREGKRRKAPAITFDAFTAQCKASGVPAIAEDDPVMSYAEKAGVTPEMLRLAWTAMRERYGKTSKRYADWRKVFRNAVQGNWFRIWYVDAQGHVALTTVGKLTERVTA